MIDVSPATSSLTADEEPPARRWFGGHTLEDAVRQARIELASARACPCCATLLAHVHERIGSTLFLDDDPVQLAAAFDATERDVFTPRVLAACVLLYGRARVGVGEID